jgi:hypothetical protein
MTRARELAELASAYDAGGLGFRNRIINGDMRIDQRNAGASVTVNAASAFYATDRFRLSGVASSGVFTGQQVSDAPSGFVNSLKATVTTTDASLAGSDIYYAVQNIEGFNTADLAWGSASATTVTLSFWAKSSLTGTFGGALSNNAVNRSYPFTYAIGAANTWEYKTVTIAGDTTGTWATDNNAGIRVYFGLGIAAGFAGTAGAWAGSQLLSATGAVNLMATNGATFYITGVQLEAGSVASPFERIDYGRQLIQCQRYFYKTTGGSNTRHAISGNGSLPQSFPTVFFKVTMRAVPTVTVSSVSHFNTEALNGAGSVVVTSIAWNAGDTDSATLNVSSAGSGGVGCNLLGNNSSAVLGYSAEL